MFLGRNQLALENLVKVFGEKRANEIYDNARKQDGVTYIRKGNVLHSLSVCHCGLYVEYYRSVNPWCLQFFEDEDAKS